MLPYLLWTRTHLTRRLCLQRVWKALSRFLGLETLKKLILPASVQRRKEPRAEILPFDCLMQWMVVSCVCWEWSSQGLDSCHAWFRENICRIWHRGKNMFHQKCHFQPFWCGTGEISHPLLDSFLNDTFRVEKYCWSAKGAGSGNLSSALMLRYTRWISSTCSCRVCQL